MAPPVVDVPARWRKPTSSALLDLANQHDARDLRRIGKRILDVVAPEAGESHGEGRCHGRFTVPSHIGAMLKRQLLALANPARHTAAELRDESVRDGGCTARGCETTASGCHAHHDDP